ncbi:MAG: hypothetical protein ACR2Q4_13920 [Geminicoccaceae bacterium]
MTEHHHRRDSFPSPRPSFGRIEQALSSAEIDDVVGMIEDTRSDCPDLGALAARLVELGHRAIGSKNASHRQIYADTMRLLRQRLEDCPLARHAFALHSRTFGRLEDHLLTSADDWVAPMVEAEIETLSPHDRSALRYTLIMRVGRQAGIHAQFRPMLLNLATEKATLACLATAGRGLFMGSGKSKSYLLAAVVRPFVDVVMADADDGIELEAAAWAWAQRTIEHAILAAPRSKSAAPPAATLPVERRMVEGGSDDLLQALGKAASLLSLIDASRRHAGELCPAQAHAGQATTMAVAEFTFSTFTLLKSKPEAAHAQYEQGIDSFIRRDFVGRSSIDLTKTPFEAWARHRPLKRLLLDLAMLTSAIHRQMPSQPLSEAAGDLGVITDKNDLLHDGQGNLIPAQHAIGTIEHYWQIDNWAGAAGSTFLAGHRNPQSPPRHAQSP